MQQGGFRKQMAQHLLTIYNDTTDTNVKAMFDEMIGTKDMLNELRESAGY